MLKVKFTEGTHRCSSAYTQHRRWNVMGCQRHAPAALSPGKRKLACKLSANLYDIYLLLCVQRKTPDDGQRNCPKHVEFYSKNKCEKLVHLVGFIIRKHTLFSKVLFPASTYTTLYTYDILKGTAILRWQYLSKCLMYIVWCMCF